MPPPSPPTPMRGLNEADAGRVSGPFVTHIYEVKAMAPRKKTTEQVAAPGIDLKDEDIFAAMKQMSGYVDITPLDFKEIYVLAYQHALARLSREVTAAEVMTKEVVLVHPDTPLMEVAEAMGKRSVSGVPVVDEGGRVVGVISE